MYRLTLLILSPLLVCGFTGCGDHSPPPGAPVGDPSPVHGKVTFPDGTPLRGGVVTFHPKEMETGRKLRYEGAALVTNTGEYKAGFNGDGKGLVPGEYIVTFAPRELGELPGSNSSRIPRQFQVKSTSQVTIMVEEMDNTINLKMK